jgi:hypothetical protein
MQRALFVSRLVQTCYHKYACIPHAQTYKWYMWHSVSNIQVSDYSTTFIYSSVRFSTLCGFCHHSMARPRAADRGDGLQIWKVTANIFSTHSGTADKEWSSWGLGKGLTTPHLQNQLLTKCYTGNIWNHKFTCFLYECKTRSLTRRKEGVREHGAEENIWI